jgi:hypothetical protein
MLLAQSDAPIVYNIATTDGVTIAIVAFLFACFVFPRTIKNRTQFYAAFFATVGIILLATLRLALYRVSPAAHVVMGVMIGLLQVATMILLFLSSGGMTLGRLTEEMKDSYEVIRRGEEEKEVIVPIRGDMGAGRAEAESERNVYVIDTPPAPPTQQRTPDRSGPVPLE